MTATRETTMMRELLSNYEGVLVSDFYAGYDGVGRRQQKCLVHLIRDLNDDLWASPFDAEFEGFVLAVRDLMVPMIEAIQGRIAKARQLAKFLPSIDTFYARQITGISYRSEVTQKLSEAVRAVSRLIVHVPLSGRHPVEQQHGGARHPPPRDPAEDLRSLLRRSHDQLPAVARHRPDLPVPGKVVPQIPDVQRVGCRCVPIGQEVTDLQSCSISAHLRKS